MLKVREFLTKPELQELVLDTGTATLERPITSVVVWEAERGLESLVGGELVCLEPRDLGTASAGLVRRLAERGVVALAVRLPAGEELTVDLPQAAAVAGIAVLRVPTDWNWERFSRLLYHEMTRLTANIEVSRNLLEEFTTLILTGGTADQIVERLHHLLGCTVLLFDAGLQLTAWSGEEPDRPACLDLGRKLHRLRPGETPFGRFVVRLDDQRPCTVKLINLRHNIFGYLVAMAAPPVLRHQDVIALHQGATAIALYLFQAEAGQEAERQHRHQFAVDLVLGRYRSPETIRSRARELGFDLSGPAHVVLCAVGPPGGEPSPDTGERQPRRRTQEVVMQGLTRVLGRRYPSVLASGFGEGVLAIIGHPAGGRPETERVRSALHEVREELRRLLAGVPVTFGLSGAAAGAVGLVDAFEQATEALDIGQRVRGVGEVVAFEDLGSYRLISRLARDRQLLEFARALLGPLVEYDRQHDGELMRTLRTLLSLNLQVEACARTLYVHANTIRYRQRKIEELARVRLHDPDQGFDMQLALRVLDVVGLDGQWPEGKG